ncbi:MAG: lytic transglycosylase domain-containing protein [Deltaproteobacteria bacterium]|nr:lytic transglycosylase domain-containing protein [Deltaproteobacteria bacterium]
MLYLALPALAESWTPLPTGAFDLALPLPEPVTAAIHAREHEAAVAALRTMDQRALAGDQVADQAFVLAWELVRAGRASEAAALVPTFEQAPTPPPAYVDLVAGEALAADGKHREAAARLEKVLVADSPIGARARLALASAYVGAEREADARRVYEAIAAEPDPSPGVEKALSWLWERLGKASKEATPHARRIYRSYPGTAEDRAIADWFVPTAEDKSYRADRLQETGQFKSATALLADTIESLPADDCVGRYGYGRAQHKQNNVTIAAAVLEPLGKACREKDPDRGAKALYLAGKSYERKKEAGNASRAYARIPEWYPGHSMADDGYTLGGIARQDAGDLEGARKLWALGMAAYPTGDLAGENAWRLAWGAWLAGDPTEAIRWADKAAAEIPLASAPTDVLASTYWAARWRAWPRDNQLTADPTQRLVAADLLEALATRAPWHFYGGLAAAQLARLDASRATRLSRPTMDDPAAPWQVPAGFVASPAGQSALALARVGLTREALAELATVDESAMSGSVAAIRMLLETRAGDFVVGHERLRAYLKTHPPGTLGPNAYKVLRVAYPEAYWSNIQAVTTKYPWDARIFHALVREESNFNPEIKSHAGACGLSQLMPGTASAVAKQAAISYSSSKIWDVDTNLRIGSYYLNELLDDNGGSPMLALASYNAGPGNTQRWLEALPPDTPVDTWTESVTFRETRHYIKRVLSTYLTYHLLYDGGATYPDWGRFVVDARPPR